MVLFLTERRGPVELWWESWPGIVYNIQHLLRRHFRATFDMDFTKKFFVELKFSIFSKKVKARRFYGSTTLAKARWGDAGWLIQSLCSPLWCICQEGSCTTNCQKIELIKTWEMSTFFWLLYIIFLFFSEFSSRPTTLVWNLTKCNFFFWWDLIFEVFATTTLDTSDCVYSSDPNDGRSCWRE